MSEHPDPFWEQPEVVERFARRLPDHRLLQLIEAYERPEEVRVLDLGCAGGRNSVLLAEHRFDVYAVDTSTAMVEETRRRVASILGVDEAQRRIRVGRMEDLSAFPAAFFHLVIALGVYHNASSRAAWQQTISETARVMRTGAELLVAVFTPQTDLTGQGLRPVASESGLYDGLPGGRAFLLEAGQLDDAMAEHGLAPIVPSETVEVPTDTGRRVTVNARYRKAAACP